MRAAWKWWWSRRWRKWLSISAIFMLVMPLVGVEVTSQSWFCNSCHIMNSYYHSWKTGSHQHVECVQCHIPPGATSYFWAKMNGAGQVVDDILERTSTKPSASVSDFSCTRSGCHDIEKVRNISRKEGKFFFNHSKHLDIEYLGIELHCTSCHSHVKGSKHFEVNTGVCITCHLMVPGTAKPAVQLAHLSTEAYPGAATQALMGGTDTQPTTRPVVPDVSVTSLNVAGGTKVPPQQCKNCHAAPKTAIEYRGLKVVHDEYLSYGAACESCHRNVTAQPVKMADDNCFSCHDFGFEKMTTVPEIHRTHTGGRHKVECFSCHGGIKHGPSAQFMRLDQFDCQSCHQKQHNIQQDTYKSSPELAHVRPDGAAVSPMFLVHVDCTGCHIKPRVLSMKPESGASVKAAAPEACDRCHKPGLGPTMIPLWQQKTHELFDAVAKLLPNETPASPQAQQFVKDARRLMEVVKLDGSWGVHNPRYTQRLLEEAKQKLMLAKEMGQTKEGAKP